MMRRALLATPFLAMAAAGGAPGVPAGGRLSFSVIRKGTVIGTHTLTFSGTAEALDIRIAVNLAIGFGPITLYRYRHSGVERYRGGRFSALETATDNDGEALHALARRDGERIVVETAKLGQKIYPATVLPLTHWNRACMTAPQLFNPQDGMPMAFRVAPPVAAHVALSDGREVPATHYALTGEATLDDWYDGSDVWTALRAVLADGSVLDYRRVV